MARSLIAQYVWSTETAYRKNQSSYINLEQNCFHLEELYIDNNSNSKNNMPILYNGFQMPVEISHHVVSP